MKQNIYDDDVFFEGYQSLRKNDSGYNRYLEEPTLRSLLPNLEGKKVLDIGCGFGDFSQYAVKHRASYYLGIDISEKMLSEAMVHKTVSVDFLHCSIEDYSYPEEEFDVVVASLCLHYIQDISAVFKKIFNSLKSDGTFVFSVEHPICTSLLKGLYETQGESHWPVDNYFNETKREQNWFVNGVVKFHRSVQSYVSTLLDAGFSIQGFSEPQPSEEDIAAVPELSIHKRRPAILVIKGGK
ncbi:class I SAM-dependent methyltransferase [Vibrio owensii]|uniref:Methyltransferase type 11 domain-containing protein n=1 Tax=Vibrio owensii CAIM 1854 = LMG 25443 TaxID=1229493 RepID=A0A0C1ZF31_9VIBR|nr:class I SAM-dependent methyltransferase [Vibrio owensii]KIF54649.1 hypothetical protein H735_01580 [Vibrio owensii CAIM 1854 = LMG 25443]